MKSFGIRSQFEALEVVANTLLRRRPDTHFGFRKSLSSMSEHSTYLSLLST